MSENEYRYIHRVNNPEQLRRLSKAELSVYCDELRDFIIQDLSNNPGHLGSSLGVIELTAALHYVFNTPQDKIVWDVGHQAYAHKIITGRRDLFHTKRKLGGLSGFPTMSESPYDAFGAGHASTSISAALGIAMADRLRGDKRQVIAVIGDGALSGGLAFEGLNNAGALNPNLLVILNDNRMAIDKNVGALKEYLLNITTSYKYNKLKSYTWKTLSKTPKIRSLVQKVGNSIKMGILQQSNLFEYFNFRYFGPVDGNNIEALTRVLNDLKQIDGPKILHILTRKGYGYKPAYTNPSLWHAPGKFNSETGELLQPECNLPPLRYQDVFGHTIIELARRNEKIVGITPAMPSGCSLYMMMEEMPERTFDVGIAEGHAVTFSGGLAANGMLPFCNIYSSFMQRAYDNVIHDVALQKLDVVFCLDRAGIVGEDGATHQGVYDIAYFRTIPDIIISSPLNESELRNLMFTAQQGGHGAFVIRYPRGRGVLKDWRTPFESIPVGRARILKEGADLAVLTFGPVGNDAAEAIARAELSGFTVEHIDLRFAKPLDEDMLRYIAEKFDKIVTIEDGALAGGVGSAVLEFFHVNGYDKSVRMLGVPDRFIPHGTPEELRKMCGYDSDGIYEAVLSELRS